MVFSGDQITGINQSWGTIDLACEHGSSGIMLPRLNNNVKVAVVNVELKNYAEKTSSHKSFAYH